ncbi:alpha/beta fold hydrolase [Croceibacterium sp. LX-88]|uniref:Alpha/beta fold hydrolase n=1 Tax=Croceibacterium selenioxidans TaxID=2838833 RepID=A0ABS5W121_9SPHN|nr:alpha/beta fold hydrolase [Croceibacterium selenioxidans]
MRRDAQEVALPASAKTRALLAYLAVTGREHRRDALCSLFWNVPDDPKGALRWSLSKLRQAVDEPDAPHLLADRETVRLEMTGSHCDFARIEEAAASDDIGTLETAARIRGEFAPGLHLRGCEEFESWLLATREDVRQRQLRVWRKLIGLLADEPERALPFARSVVEADPLGEDGWVTLVALLADAGRSDEAEAQRGVAVRTLEAAGIEAEAALTRPVRSAATAAPRPVARENGKPVIRQRVEFCTARDGTGLAYSCVGNGPPLVKTANWLNHLEFEWESPIWSHWIEALSRDHKLVRYDERGNGLSDWKVADLSFEAFVQDLETVVDAAGVEQFDLLGISQGCAVSIAYAVRHPERVRSMILYGGYSQGWKSRNDPEELARREAMVTLTGVGWGQGNPAFRQMFTTLYFPEATDEQAQWFNELQRISASPEGAQRLQRALGVIDVRHLLRKVKVPTLILHSRNDSVVPFEAGRILARHIEGARFVPLDSPNHLVLAQEPAWPELIAHIREFLANPRD